MKGRCTITEAAAVLGISRQAIHKKARRLELGVQGERGTWYFTKTELKSLAPVRAKKRRGRRA